MFGLGAVFGAITVILMILWIAKQRGINSDDEDEDENN